MLSQNSILIFIITSLTLLASFCLFIVFVFYKYQKKQIAHSKELAAVKTNFENSLLASQLELQEQTLEQVSREIHDNIGQKLSLAKLFLNTLDIQQNPAAAKEKIDDTISLLSLSIDGLSDISRSIGSDMLLNNGLVKSVEMELEKIEKSGAYQTSLIIEGKEVFLDGTRELILFRIVQESLNNILKHADASRILIHICYDNSQLELCVFDDGKGFSEASCGKGAGLANIKKRAALLLGQCIIGSQEAGGKITIKIPIHEPPINHLQSNSSR